uniref:hypothetical protein n=1 Tax=Yersinia kristensenii TaxID=28152 RepID=UPI0011A8DE17
MKIISSVPSNTQIVIANDNQKDKSDSSNIMLEKIKLEIVTAFTGIEYDANSKISNLIKRNTNVTTLDDVIISVNKYLEKSKGTD